jgi:hypothetical protein
LKKHDLQRLASLLRVRGWDAVDTAEPLVNALAEAYFSDRYPGFDLDDPDWTILRQQLEETGKLLEKIKARLAPP